MSSFCCEEEACRIYNTLYSVLFVSKTESKQVKTTHILTLNFCHFHHVDLFFFTVNLYALLLCIPLYFEANIAMNV